MEDHVVLKVLCLEYQKFVSELLKNESYLSEQKKEAYSFLLRKFQETAVEFNKQASSSVDEYFVAGRDGFHAEFQNYRKIMADINSPAYSKEIEARVTKKKIEVVGKMLEEKGINPYVLDGRIEFRKDNALFFSCGI